MRTATWPGSSPKMKGVQAAAARKFEEASSHLSGALGQWRGEVLADLRDFPFVEPFAAAVTEDKLWVHTARAEAEIACGRAYAVIGELEALTAQHPYREPLWAQLITAYYVTERQSDALDAYRRLKTSLATNSASTQGRRSMRCTSGSCVRSHSTPNEPHRTPPSLRPR